MSSMPTLVHRGLLFLAAGGCAALPVQSPLEAQAPRTEWRIPALPSPTPIAAAEFQARRAALAAGMSDGTLLVLGESSPAAAYLSFSQTPDFRYLTGISEPGAALMITKRGSTVEETLFVLPRNPAREIWDGERLGVDGAEARTGIPALPRSFLESALDSVTDTATTLYTTGRTPGGEDLLLDLSAEQQVIARMAARKLDLRLQSLSEEIQRLRAAKSPAELDRIRRAVHITALAHREAMRAIEPGMNEFEIQALIEYTFRRHGAERPGFASIVGSGPNATTLHYTRNDRFFEPEDMVVMDIGASYDGYTADVTRTVPVDGTFSPDQRAIYEIVLAAQKAAEARARPGATWQELNAAAGGVIADGLTRLGLIDSPGATFASDAGEVRQVGLFYMHGLGHGIGLEVHDPDVSYYGAFRPGSAFTIEPGIYVRSDALDYLPDTPDNRAMIQRLRPVIERYRNIGVRIEDDYRITAGGVEWLSSGAPREVAEIEALMASRPSGTAERQPEVVEWYRSLERN